MLISQTIKNLGKIPPTRGIRYKDSLHNLLLKNSIRTPSDSFFKEKPTYQIFNVIWNDDMTRFQLKSTKKNKFTDYV